jgi:Tfp pilus assembly protein PilO
MIVQIPVPPDAPVIVQAGTDPGVAIIGIVGLIAGTLILWPLVRAIARRIEHGTGEAHLRGEMEAMRARLAEMDAVQHRVAELEERVDFAERLLAQRAEAPRLERERS